MLHLDRIKQLGTISIIVLLLIGAAAVGWMNTKTEERPNLTIGAGAKTGEAFAFALAIQDIVARYHPELEIEVIETRGTQENMKLLQENQIQLATAQADVKAEPAARIVTYLYPDLFQLVVHDQSNIHSFEDLVGKKIALPKRGGGQWISFWFVAAHYGIDSTQIEGIPMSSDQATQALIQHQVDAIFKVRAAPNEQIAHIIQSCPSRIVPITQGAAMKLKQPSLDEALIPEGAYRGNPPIPETDISTIAVDRLLVAREDAPAEAIKLITQVLFERRRELLQKTPLAGFIRQPRRETGTFIPVHIGAQQFYDREKLPYLVENADFFALILSLLLVLTSGILGVRSFLINKQKNKADEYTKELVKLTEVVRGSHDVVFIQQQQDALHQMLSEVIRDLDKDRVNPEGFTFFSFTWNVAYNLIKERLEKVDMTKPEAAETRSQ